MHNLLEAAGRGDINEVKREIEEVLSDINMKVSDVDSRTALYFAVENNHIEVVKYLLENYASLNIKDSNNMTPLHVAAEKNYEEVAKLLIIAGANLSAENDMGQTPYRVAEMKNSYKVLRLIVSFCPSEDVSISREIKPKICKVISDYGTSTGFFIDDENGIVLTSFHIAGKIKLEKILFNDRKIVGILYLSGYIDQYNYLTKKAEKAITEDDINLVIYEELPKPLDYEDGEKIVIDSDYLDYICKNIPNYKRCFLDIFKDIVNSVEKFIALTSKLEIQIDNELLMGQVYNLSSESSSNSYALLKNYAFFDMLPIQITQFADGTKYYKNSKFIDTGRPINIFKHKVPLQIGETLYLGGYPLEQEEYTFTRGVLSSILQSNDRQIYIIEAPIAPGNSGSPVFVKRNGEIYLIGMLNSEVAYITEEIFEIKRALEDIINAKKTVLTLDFIDGRRLSIPTALYEITEVLLRNMSTGKGKVSSILNLSDLYAINFSKDLPFPSLQKDFLITNKFHKFNQIPSKIKFLYQYINFYKICRLTIIDIKSYLAAYADIPTREKIFALLDDKDLDKNTYIKFPGMNLNQDQYVKRIANDGFTLDFSDNSEKVVGKCEHYKEKIKAFYLCAVLCGHNFIENAIFNFSAFEFFEKDKSLFSEYNNTYLTNRFYERHLGDGNRALTEQKADSVYEERNILNSTLILLNHLKDLSEEAKDNQVLYGKAEKQAKEQANLNIVHSIFFLTKKSYQLITRSSDPLKNKRLNSKFFYSVIKKSDKYFIHHFENSESNVNIQQQEDWQLIQPIEITAYYKIYNRLK